MSQCKRGAFTLVELLAVVAIIGIAFAIAVPSFTGMTEGMAMRASVAEVKSTLSLARQWAISHREETYVLLPQGGIYSGPYDGDQGMESFGDMAFHAYTVWSAESGYISQWKYLKQGVYFIPDESADGLPPDMEVDSDKNPFELGVGMIVKFPDDRHGSDQRLRVIGFRPDGRAFIPGASALTIELYLGEGLIADTIGEDDIDADSLVLKPGRAVFGVQVNSITGGLRIRDYAAI